MNNEMIEKVCIIIFIYKFFIVFTSEDTCEKISILFIHKIVNDQYLIVSIIVSDQYVQFIIY